jgi:hypothetical protein
VKTHLKVPKDGFIMEGK